MARVSPPVRRPGWVCFDEFCALTGERKGDLVDGVIFLDPPEAPSSNELWGWLLGWLGILTDQKNIGKLFGPRVVFRLDDRNAVEPDLALVSRRHLGRIRKSFVAGPPDVAIEIVAPESAERDYVLKRRLYESAGVKEYWILDDAFRTVSLLQRDATGRFRKSRPRLGQLHSRIIAGFCFCSDWLLPELRPERIWQNGATGWRSN